jgi:hypothetical protein
MVSQRAVTCSGGKSSSARASNAAAIASWVASSAPIIASTTSCGIRGPGRPWIAWASAMAAESDVCCSSASSVTGTGDRPGSHESLIKADSVGAVVAVVGLRTVSVSMATICGSSWAPEQRCSSVIASVWLRVGA